MGIWTHSSQRVPGTDPRSGAPPKAEGVFAFRSLKEVVKLFSFSVFIAITEPLRELNGLPDQNRPSKLK